jgi:serine/threonine-protein kinase
MGKVYFGFDLRVKREVVIKVLHENIASQASFRERFEQEMDFMKRFQHPNVVAFYDSSVNDRNGPCIVMEYIKGKPLDVVLREQRRLPPVRVGMLLVPICKALYAAHQARILHRDLKPANLMVTNVAERTESVKILDFGLASLANALYIPKERLENPTEYFSACGTPDYMCPEQVRGDELDHRSDLYSVGVILYEMLTGRSPFSRGTVEKTMLAQTEDRPPPFVAAGARGIPPAVESVVMHALGKYPVERPSSARELSERLERALGVRFTTAADWEVSPTAPVRAPAAKAANPVPVPPGAVVHVMEAWMPERIAVVKLQGFVGDLGGEVVESVPGRIRVQFGVRQQAQGSGLFSALGLTGSKQVALRPVIDLELHMEKREAGHASKLYITAVYKATGGRSQAMMPAWRQKCDQIHRDLRAYLMGRA